MADDTTTPAPSTGGDPGSNAGGQGAGGNTGTPTAGQQQQIQQTQQGDEKRFTQADIDRILKERLGEEQKRREKAAADEEARKNGEFEKLLTARDTELATARAELAAERLKVLRAAAAAKHKLPAEMADRLRGETEEELAKDAEALAKLVPAQAPSGSGTANPGGAGTATGKKFDPKNPPSWGSIFDRK